MLVVFFLSFVDK